MNQNEDSTVQYMEAGGSMAGEETIYLEEPGVRITGTQVVLGRHGFLTKDITSVSLEELKPRPTIPYLLTMIGFLVFAYIVFKNVLGVLLLIIILAPSLLVILKPRARYVLKIATAENETRPVLSLDKLEIQRLIDTINQALLHSSDPHPHSEDNEAIPSAYSPQGLENQFIPTVPENCIKCDLPLTTQTVEWTAGNQANCPRCGAPIEVIWRKIPQKS